MRGHIGGLKDMEVIPKDHLTDGAFYFNRALAYYGLNKYADCKKEMDNAIKCDTTIANFWILSANVEARLKMYEEAMYDGKKAGDLGIKDGYTLYSGIKDYLKKHPKK